MKKILITGAGSYVGGSVRQHLQQWPDRYLVDELDMLEESWRQADFSGYDAVYHVAGIAHADSGPISPEQSQRYYRVNTDLAVETAQKAKAEGVKQFIFMSSAIVYGDSAPVGQDKCITRDTVPAPANSYGDSKLQAEKGLAALEDGTFRVALIRAPMIYGPGSKGNYPILAKLAAKLPVFPRVENSRSMLYIRNLAEFVRLLVENEDRGIFWPQNTEYSNTSRLVAMIAEARGKRVLLVGGFGWALKLLSRVTPLVNKAFGSLRYDTALSDYPQNYCICSLRDSIQETECVK